MHVGCDSPGNTLLVLLGAAQLLKWLSWRKTSFQAAPQGSAVRCAGACVRPHQILGVWEAACLSPAPLALCPPPPRFQETPSFLRTDIFMLCWRLPAGNSPRQGIGQQDTGTPRTWEPRTWFRWDSKSKALGWLPPQGFCTAFPLPAALFPQISTWLPIAQEVPGSKDTLRWKPPLPAPISCHPPLQPLLVSLFIFLRACITTHKSNLWTSKSASSQGRALLYPWRA